MLGKRLIIFALIAALIFGGWLYQRPLPSLHAELVTQSTNTSKAIKMPWPHYGQAAFGAVGFGVLATHNTDSPVPIASIAKTITALAILKQKPLQIVGQEIQPAPAIEITSSDVKTYYDYLSRGGSVVAVKAGEKITEYQALQAMMLPSANNIADTAAHWAFGSIDDYVTYANNFVRSMGLTHTQIADASGFSPKTTSTASDLVLLGEAALSNPVLSHIMSQTNAKFPGVGTIHNLNGLLGKDGIIGIKTGNTDEAGGCYLFAAKRQVGQSVRVVGAILGAPTRNQAMSDSRKLVRAADQGFEMTKAVRANQVVGRYSLPWGGSVDAVASSSLTILNWKGQPVLPEVNFNNLQPPVSQGAVVGQIKVKRYDGLQDADTVPLKITQQITGPSWSWKIFR